MRKFSDSASGNGDYTAQVPQIPVRNASEERELLRQKRAISTVVNKRGKKKTIEFLSSMQMQEHRPAIIEPNYWDLTPKQP
jgi:hypothetical protein